MASIQSDIQRILDLAPDYTPDVSPRMEQRAEHLADLVAILKAALSSDPGNSWRAAFNLQVRRRGQQGHVALIPWVRIYSPAHAPKAEEGIYLAYLFAADGSRAYLSLMHGSSEYRSGSTRAIRNARVLRTQVAVSRNALGDLLESDGAAGAAQVIDLKWAGFRSPDRAIAYENATILARGYPSGRIPQDEKLLADFYGMLPLLARLYDEDLAVDSGTDPDEPEAESKPSAGTRHQRTAGQGQATDAEVRRKIEQHAERHAFELYTSSGWKVKPVGQFKRGYDLECTKDDGSVLHVEVKGTRSFGETVRLTANEVDHVLSGECAAEHALYILSEIDVTYDVEIHCTGGKRHLLQPWAIAIEALTPAEFIYAVP